MILKLFMVDLLENEKELNNILLFMVYLVRIMNIIGGAANA